MSKDAAPINDLTKLRREPQLADPQWSTIKQILRDSYLCHFAFADENGQPFAIPTIHALIGDDLYIHGSAASRSLRALRDGAKVCVTVTRTDGFVLARSVLHHNINFRCVMVFGEATIIDAPGEKEAALEAYFEEVFPGRWAESREPTEKEFARVSILKIPLNEASAKISSGPAEDEAVDYDLNIWAGVIPIREVLGAPEPDPMLRSGIPSPPSLARIRERWS